MRVSILFLLCIVSFSCGQAGNSGHHANEGKRIGNTCHSDDIGWTMSIPHDWTIISDDKATATHEKGMAALEKATGMHHDMKNMKHIISFQKDSLNAFSSTAEPFSEKKPGEYEQHNRDMYGMICQTYANEGITSDTSSGTEMIGGLQFHTFYITIRNADREILLNQVLYSRLINDYDFAVNINYTNPTDKATMVDAFRASTFTGK
jgi:hypothetical protein